MYAQLFNFSLRTNNQQVIDVALQGAFFKIDESYELCDTVRNEHFGRNEKNYFNKVSFVGVNTEKGLCYLSLAETPWVIDKDFEEYNGYYKPILTETNIKAFNDDSLKRIPIEKISSVQLNSQVSILPDASIFKQGLAIDSLPGEKEGWIVWISTSKTLSDADSVKYTSIYKKLHILEDGSPFKIDSPESTDSILGGVFITAKQVSVGHLCFSLVGMVIPKDTAWEISFPFIHTPLKKVLTPIVPKIPNTGINQWNKKRK
jgi:hypothetical protein